MSSNKSRTAANTEKNQTSANFIQTYRFIANKRHDSAGQIALNARPFGRLSPII